MPEEMKKDAEEIKEEKKPDAAEKEEAKDDADAGVKLDKMLSCVDAITRGVDSLTKRMDALEAKKTDDDDDDDDDKAKKDDDDDAAKAKKDAEEKPEFLKKEEVAADKKRKDDDDDDSKKAKADSDKRFDDVAKRIADVESKLPKAMTDSDHRALADAQAKADSVYQAHGLHAARPLDGEDLLSYRKRLASNLKAHSNVWKGIDLTPIADATFDVVEGQVYADAMAAANNPVDLPDFALRAVTRVDSTTGQRMTNFYGKNTFISQLKRPSRRVANIGVRKDH